MSETWSCGDEGALVGYLYGESDPEQREVIAAHLEGCASCTRELASLDATRRQLAAWTPPHVALGFRISGDADVVPHSQAWWRQPLPAWMQVAAAALLFIAGLAFGAARGSSPEAAQPAGSANLAPSGAASPVVVAVSQRDLTRLEERLRAEMTQLRAAASVALATRGRDRREDEAVLTGVRALIKESEERQRGELARRTVQIMLDVENQRRVDFRRWGEVQGATGAEVQQHREIINALARRVSLQR